MKKIDNLVQMQHEVDIALSKQVAERKWAMLIDTRVCVGCHACTVGCMAENVLSPSVSYRSVYEKIDGTYPNVKRQFVARPCMQCEEPICVKDCPVSATKKATDGVEAGVVVIDYEVCIGCGTCVEACPYNARSLDDGAFFSESSPKVQDYEKRNFNEYSNVYNRGNEDTKDKARKCHFCVHRLKEGQLPMCVTTCIARAIYFGDMNDKNSLISKMINENKVVMLKSATDSSYEFGESITKPTVYYIVDGGK